MALAKPLCEMWKKYAEICGQKRADRKSGDYREKLFIYSNVESKTSLTTGKMNAPIKRREAKRLS